MDASNGKAANKGKNFYAVLQAKRKQTKQKKMGAVPEQQISPKQPMSQNESKKDIQTFINASELKRSADRAQILNDQILQKVLTLERQQMRNTERA